MTGFKLLSVHVQNLNKEPAESRWKPGSQARGNRAGRGNYSSRHVSQDAGGGRSSYTVKERATSQIPEKVVSKSPLVNAQELKTNEASSIARNQTVLVAMENSEAKYPGHTQSVSQGPEIFLCSEFEVPSSINPDYGESKQEVAPRIHQHPVVHSSSNYNIGFMQPILSGQLPPFESSESQTRDVPQLPSFASEGSCVSEGQLAYTSTQAGHGAFTGIFHPAQAVTAATVHPLLLHSQVISNHVDMGGSTAGVYQL
ncbi:UNVERIFIED_CONTAM: hypothetical protein Sangu_2407500 [Sesamum angustifolium]|uniref:GBF-interacting protein 1 N-terminal domain-containing protein n=1 Tax=Sesamum angustifolium TaxID=2727405 RepID=A0AAW2KXB7_9LAMI